MLEPARARTARCMQMDYEWGYDFGAVDVISGESEFLLLLSVSLGLSLLFLRDRRARAGRRPRGDLG